jgi:universal stress protein A
MQHAAVMAFQKILCPIDFSEPSRLALHHAAQLARESAAELVVAHAWQSPMHPEYSEGILHNELLAPRLEEQQAALAAAKREVEALGPTRVATKLLYGVPWDAIARETREDPGYDLVVIGTHGRTGIRHVLLGSVAERVARHASCPVLLVRAKEPTPR